MNNILRKEWLLWRAQRRLHRNDTEHAITILKRAARIFHNHPRVWVILAQAYFHCGDTHNAEKALKRALELDPENASYHLQMGQVYYDMGHYDIAQQELEYCLSQQPDNHLAQNFLALTRYHQGAHAEALDMLASAGLCNNTEFLSRCSALFEKEIMDNPEQFPEPSTQYEEIVSSTLYRLYDAFRNKTLLARFFKFFLLRKCFHRATRLLTYGNYDGAVELLNFALTISPTNTDALSGIGVARYEQGEFEKAKDIFLGLLDDETYEPLMMVYLGLCYYRLEQYDAALALFERVADNKPEDFNANYYAALCYLAKGKRQEALRFFVRAYRHYFVDTSEQCLDKLLHRVSLSK